MTFLILPAYFQKHRGLALGLNSTSNSLGQMIIPQLIRVLSHRFDGDGTILAYSGILFFMCLAAALYKPVKNITPALPQMNEEIRSHTEKKCTENDIERGENVSTSIPTANCADSTDVKKSGLKTYFKRCFTSLKLPTVLMIGFSYGMFTVGHMNFTMLIPFIVTEAGFTADDATYCLSTYAVSNLVSRAVNSFLSDRSFFNTKLVYMSGGVLAAVLCVCEYILFVELSTNDFSYFCK